MSFKLTKAQVAERAKLTDALEEAAEALREAIERANGKIDEVRQAVKADFGAYNEAVSAAKEWVDAHADEWRDAYEEKSEKWEESEAASKADTLILEYQDADLEEIDFEDDLPTDIEEPDLHHADTLRDLPTEA